MKHKLLILVFILALPVTSVLAASTRCDSADINNDGMVDQTDYDLLLADFLLTNPVNPKSEDGIVDLTDYSIFVSHYLNKTGLCQP
jgi:hypothetical protein